MRMEVNAMAVQRKEKSLGLLKDFNMKEYEERRLEKAMKKCDQCGKRRHVKDECFKLKGAPEWFEKLLKEIANVRQASNVGREQEKCEENIPLDGPMENGETSSARMDNNMKFVIVQEVMKAMVEKQGFNNFAGKLLASNVCEF